MVTRIYLAAIISIGVAASARAQTVMWTQEAVSGPSPRSEFGMAFDSGRGVAVLFGGTVASNPSMSNGETWEWSGGAGGGGAGWTPRPVSGPSARYGHAMVFDSTHGVTVLFGGYGGGAYSGETWEWDGSAWVHKSPLGSPSPRSGHAMAFDSARTRVVLFGGQNVTDNNSYYGDTWEGTGAGWGNRGVGGPSPRVGHTMAYDPVRHVTVLFGGSRIINIEGQVLYGDTWEWNGTAWTQRAAPGPSARTGATMVYDAGRGVTVLFGGYAGAYVNDTWEWDGSAWTQRAVSGPPPRFEQGMVYDTAHTEPVLFGGRSNNFLGDTWVLGRACGSADFNGDGDIGTDADIEAFFACLSGTCCPTCGSADFNGDGDVGTDADIESFFRVLAGGQC